MGPSEETPARRRTPQLRAQLSAQLSWATQKKTLTFYELLGDVRVASPRLGDLGRTLGWLRGFSARFPRTGHDGPTRPKIATLARKNQHRINAHDALDDLDDSRI